MDNSRRIRRFRILGGIFVIGLALYGFLSVVSGVSAFVSGDRLISVQEFAPEMLSTIFEDTDGDPSTGYENQIVVGSVRVFYDSDTGKYILIVSPPSDPFPPTEE